MLHSRITRNVLLTSLLTLTLLFAGCFGSKFTLIAPDKAKVDRAYVGDWDMVNPKGEHFVMSIRNIDDKMYYIDFKSKDDPQVSRYVGFLAPAGSATFAEARELKDDGSIAEDWVLMRIQMSDGWITLRQLNDDFFKGKAVDSADQLRALVEKNAENDAMYAKDEVLTGKKVAK